MAWATYRAGQYDVLGPPSLLRCLFVQPHIPEVPPAHVKRAVDMLTHDRQPERVAMLDKGHPLPEKPVDILPEPIAPLERQLRLHGLQQLSKVGITVPSGPITAQAVAECRIRGYPPPCGMGIPQVWVEPAPGKCAPLHQLQLNGKSDGLQLLLGRQGEPVLGVCPSPASSTISFG